jgi:hypothetical protein
MLRLITKEKEQEQEKLKKIYPLTENNLKKHDEIINSKSSLSSPSTSSINYRELFCCYFCSFK